MKKSGITAAVVRSIIGVVLGYAIFAVSAVFFFWIMGRDPHASQDAAFVVGAVLFGMATAMLGGFVAGLVAGQRPILHSGIVSVILAVGALVSLLSSPGEDAVWSQVSALCLMAPSAVMGGIARAKFSSRK
jgi:hypothetical protein